MSGSDSVSETDRGGFFTWNAIILASASRAVAEALALILYTGLVALVVPDHTNVYLTPSPTAADAPYGFTTYSFDARTDVSSCISLIPVLAAKVSTPASVSFTAIVATITMGIPLANLVGRIAIVALAVVAGTAVVPVSLKYDSNDCNTMIFASPFAAAGIAPVTENVEFALLRVVFAINTIDWTSVFAEVPNEVINWFDDRVAPLPSLIFRLPGSIFCTTPPLSIWIDAMIVLFPAGKDVEIEANVVSVVPIAVDEPST